MWVKASSEHEAIRNPSHLQQKLLKTFGEELLLIKSRNFCFSVDLVAGSHWFQRPVRRAAPFGQCPDSSRILPQNRPL